MALTDKLNAIGNAIRSKTGKTEKLSLEAMVTEIESLEIGGGSAEDKLDLLMAKTLTAYSNEEVDALAFTFANCTSLETASFPNVTIIGEYTFRNCAKLKELNVPKVQTIGNYGLFACASLIDGDFPNVTTVGAYSFQGTTIESLNMPELTTINTCSFYGARGLKSIYAPKLKAIANQSFRNTLLEIADFPVAITCGTYPFSGCTQLTEINLPSLTSAITNTTFFNTNDTPNVTKLTMGNVKSITANAFSKWSALTDIYVPFSEGDIANAPWGATNATIHYNAF